MKFLNTIFSFFNSGRQLKTKEVSHILEPWEIRLIVEGQPERLIDFASSSRIYSVDAKGNTPLHLAARAGNLLLCELFIRAGLDINLLNHKGQSSIDVAGEAGHQAVSQFLLQFVARSEELRSCQKDELRTKVESAANSSSSYPALSNKASSDNAEPLCKAMKVVSLTPSHCSEGQLKKQASRETGDIASERSISSTEFRSFRGGNDKSNDKPEQIGQVPAGDRGRSLESVKKQNGLERSKELATPDLRDDLDDLLVFEAEIEPEEFVNKTTSGIATGEFIATNDQLPLASNCEVEDWVLDLTPAPISGEGIGSSIGASADNGIENNFLKVRNRGPKSIKKSVVNACTQMSIDASICVDWARDVIAKRRCTTDDIDNLVAHCEGDVDLGELRSNLKRNLEIAGFDLRSAKGWDMGVWDSFSDIAPADLAEGIEVVLTRGMRLPGLRRFTMDKADELKLLEPMTRARHELQLGVLASEAAINSILEAFDGIQNGTRSADTISLKTIMFSRPDHPDTLEVLDALNRLRSWHAAGRVLDGKRRREALGVLAVLDLSLAFYKELVCRLQRFPDCQTEARRLETQILFFESVTQLLIYEYLPYVRRFASRNTEEGEDPEDVFQVAFMGLMRATRRFDPERGYRFLNYATYWMRQAITRWRADEGAAIRIPVHRHAKIFKLDRTLERLDIWVGGIVSDLDLAEELDWTIDEVRQSRDIPREAEYPESLEEWDNLLTYPSDGVFFEQIEVERIVADILTELPERQADIIRMRFGIGHHSDMTLEEIGQIYGVTRERIRQLEAKALKRLSHPSRKRRLQELLGL